MLNEYFVNENLTYIKLNSNKAIKWTIIDTKDLPKIDKYPFTWSVIDNGRNIYAGILNNHSKSIMMHRVICDLSPSDDRYIDHINIFGLDNRHENLQIVTSGQNNCLAAIINNKGIYWAKKEQKWYINITIDGIKYKKGFIDRQTAINNLLLLKAISLRTYLYGLELGELDDSFVASIDYKFITQNNINAPTICAEESRILFKDQIFFRKDKARWIVSPRISKQKRVYRSFISKEAATIYANELENIVYGGKALC